MKKITTDKQSHLELQFQSTWYLEYVRFVELKGQFEEPVPEPLEAIPHRCSHCDGELKFIRKIPRLNLSRGPP